MKNKIYDLLDKFWRGQILDNSEKGQKIELSEQFPKHCQPLLKKFYTE